jgi:peroxiredoxin (alkyl hydroperoxide reductase subunit C)
MTAHVGLRAPWIELDAYRRDADGAVTLTAGDLRGRWAVLVFYPRDFTFVCPTELHAFAQLERDFADAGATIVAVSTDSYWSHKAWYETHPALADATYAVAADTTHALTEAYGILAEDGSALRGTFVVDPDGVLRHATVSDQSVGRNPEETLRVLHALQTGELCPVSWRPGQPTLRIAA